jgi:hypothetical protein
LRSSTAYKRIRPFRIHAHPALSVASRRTGKTSPLDRIQQQGADLLSLVDEHLHVDPNGLLLPESAHVSERDQVDAPEGQLLVLEHEHRRAGRVRPGDHVSACSVQIHRRTRRL